MTTARRSYRFSLQAKVMAVVVAVMVALPAITLTIVDGRLRQQMRLDADLALAMAHGSFVQALKMRTAELVARLRISRSDQRFVRIVRLNDAPTMRDFLQRYLLEELPGDTELALFVTPAGEVRGARRDATPATPETLAAAAAPFIQAALHGEDRAGSIALGGAAYHVVAGPVSLPEGPAGAMVVGFRIGDAMLQDVRPPACEILVTAGGTVLAATLEEAAQHAAVLRQLADIATEGRAEALVRLAGQRYQPVTGALAGGGGRPDVQYVLLTAMEQRLGAFERSRLLMLGWSAAGILGGTAIIWFFLGRITRPLVALRDSAEAVGRGDFSQRIERYSNDECGELAGAFNRMTSNLQTSRAELEQAMQQLRATQEQLIQSEKLSAVGQFVAGVAHELNNPLTAVVGFSELLQGTATDEKMRLHLDRIAKSAHRCHKVVENLLSFARQRPPERRLVGLHAVIDEVLELMSYDLRTSNVTVVRELDPALPEVNADRYQLQQVFINILGNARQAMESFPRDGRVVVRTRSGGGELVVEFEDNGPGIKPDHLARIFDPFFTTKPVGKGTGLGLSLCYGIIQEHGGKITARSTPGQGATFTISLPVAREAAPATVGEVSAGSSSPFRPRPAGAASLSVLVVDDEEWILELATELLRAAGHTVDVAQGGQRALELLQRRHYDAIISDWKMPGLNGIRLFEHLQAISPATARRVLFMTGDVVSDGFQEFLQANSLTCLSKPFAAREFNAAVDRLTKARGNGSGAGGSNPASG